MQNPLIIDPSQDVSGISLSFDSEQAWIAYGAQLRRAGGQLMWLIGRWWIAGEASAIVQKDITLRELTQRPDWLGPSHEVCRAAAHVCRRFPPERTRPAPVTYYDHAEVMALPERDQEQVLDWVLQRRSAGHSLTRIEVKNRVLELKRQSTPTLWQDDSVQEESGQRDAALDTLSSTERVVRVLALLKEANETLTDEAILEIHVTPDHQRRLRGYERVRQIVCP